MSEYTDKLKKIEKLGKPKEQDLRVGFFGDEDIERIHKSLADIHLKLQERIAEDKTAAVIENTKKLDELLKAIESLKTEPPEPIDLSRLEKLVESLELNPNITVTPPETHVVTEYVNENIFDIYRPADVITDGSTKYYGYLAKDGRWFIMRETNTDGVTKYRYTTGSEGFRQAFKSKVGLDYKYIDEVDL